MSANVALVRKIRTINPVTQATLVKHLIGLRKIHLAPDTVPDPETLNSIPSDSVEVILETDSDVKEIELYADELVLLGGTQLSRPGRKISIVCRTATIVGSKRDVTFSVEKLDDRPLPEEVKEREIRETNRKGADAQPSVYPFQPKDSNDPRKKAESGKAGDSGPMGVDGNHAGSFHFRGTFDLKDKETGRIIVKANGGKGGKGGPGENGGAGGSGFRNDKPNEVKANFKFNDFVTVLDYIYGAAGGQGGNGGQGGQGGSGGAVDIKYAISVKGVPLLKEQVDANKELIAFDIQINAGGGGEGGEPASGGNGGNHTNIPFETTIHHPIQGNDVLICEKLEGMNIIENGLDGYDQSTGGEFPMVVTTSWAWFKLNLDKLPSISAAGSGSKGDVGPNGQNGMQTIALVATTATATDLLSSSLNNASFVGMLLDRLIFEYFINFATQVYDLKVPEKLDPKVAPALELTPVQEQFWRSWEWARTIIDVCGGAGTDELESTLWAMPKAALLRLDMMVHGGKDIFKASLNAVPNPTSGIPETSAALEDFEKVSECAEAALKALEKSAGLLTVMNNNIQDVKSRLGTASGNSKKQDDRSKELEGQIRTAGLDIQNAVQNLEAKSEKLKDMIQSELNANLYTVIEAISMVCMFSNPESGAAFAIGSLLSVGSAASQSVIKATSSLETETGVAIKKKFVVGRIHTFMSDGSKLREDISRAFVEKKKGEVEKGEQYLTQLRVDAEKFDAMAESYIPKGDESNAVKAALKKLIEAVQTKNNLVQDYNECQAVRAQQRVDAEAFLQTIDQLEKHKGNEDSSSQQLRSVFFNHVYSDMARKAFEFIYEVARNFNCIALEPTTLFKCLKDLQSFTQLTPVVLKSAFKTYLINSDIHDFKPLLYSLGSTTDTHPLKVRLTKDKDSEYFDQLKDKDRRGFTFFFTHALADTLFPDSKNWWDVRLVSLNVYLVGAVATTDAVRIEIGTPGVMSYRSKLRKIHQFKLPPQHTTIGYEYKQPKDVESFKLVTDAFSGNRFKFTLAEREERIEYKLPMESPFAAWTLKAYDSVNLQDADEVVFDFTVCYRTL